ncbi:hypothetical protein [Neobacillus muris]|uniref:hypothetical protein n=1 Tax=Neobacillus muris TaxID=2941334 RepID=UPI00203ABFA1|nr:hypothetical protein [Neobacillus muris]
MVTSIIPASISAGAALLSVCLTAYSVMNLVRSNKQLNKDKREAQARKIAAWLTRSTGESDVIIQNTSNTPIYDVLIVAVAITGAAPYDGVETMKANNTKSGNQALYPYLVFQKIPPGKFIKEFGFLEGGMHVTYGIEYAFTDSYGNAWRIDGKGRLSELGKNYLYEMYCLENPAPWCDLDYFNDSLEKPKG